MQHLFQGIQFVTSAHDLHQLPAESVAEIAFAGRSNCGKSSALNALSRRHKLARVSKTPGRTQLINFFTFAPGVFLVDLPGYGYAKVPEKIQSHWEHALGGYLRTRAQIRGLVLIMDSRHPLTNLDQQMLNWYGPSEDRPVHILLSKADKLTRREAAATLTAVTNACQQWPGCSVQLFSSLNKQGVEAAETVIGTWVQEFLPPPV